MIQNGKQIILTVISKLNMTSGWLLPIGTSYACLVNALYSSRAPSPTVKVTTMEAIYSMQIIVKKTIMM